MHRAAKLQFERVAREFAQWRAVPDDERSPAPGGGGSQPLKSPDSRTRWAPQVCHHLEFPLASTHAAGATLLMATLSDQTSLPWPDEFPRKFKEGANDQMEQVR